MVLFFAGNYRMVLQIISTIFIHRKEIHLISWEFIEEFPDDKIYPNVYYILKKLVPMKFSKDNKLTIPYYINYIFLRVGSVIAKILLFTSNYL